jgi:hypothetical protein
MLAIEEANKNLMNLVDADMQNRKEIKAHPSITR